MQPWITVSRLLALVSTLYTVLFTLLTKETHLENPVHCRATSFSDRFTVMDSAQDTWAIQSIKTDDRKFNRSIAINR